MNVEMASKPLAWGELDLSLFGIAHDWQGKQVDPPIAFGFATDLAYLWFVACRQSPASIHPQARPGAFQAELWRHDVAEFFLVDPETGRYLEFNLAPNGAWWSASFDAPRQRTNEDDSPFPGVATYADIAPDGSWMAAAALPLDQLKEEFHFGGESRLNASFIINSPEQQFLSAAKLPGETPDFHQPQAFPKINFFHQAEQGS